MFPGTECAGDSFLDAGALPEVEVESDQFSVRYACGRELWAGMGNCRRGKSRWLDAGAYRPDLLIQSTSTSQCPGTICGHQVLQLAGAICVGSAKALAGNSDYRSCSIPVAPPLRSLLE